MLLFRLRLCYRSQLGIHHSCSILSTFVHSQSCTVQSRSHRHHPSPWSLAVRVWTDATSTTGSRFEGTIDIFLTPFLCIFIRKSFVIRTCCQPLSLNYYCEMSGNPNLMMFPALEYISRPSHSKSRTRARQRFPAWEGSWMTRSRNVSLKYSSMYSIVL